MKKIPAFSILSILLAAMVLSGCDSTQEARTGVCGGNGIVGCQSVETHDSLAPKVVMVKARLNDHEASLCTGTLIARNVVITAAHCLNGAQSARVVFDVDPGCNPNFNPNSQSVEVKKAAIHPKYSKDVKGKYDLALLKLESSAPSQYDVIRLYDGTSQLSSAGVTYAGYGRTSERNQTDQALRSVVKNYKETIFFAKDSNMVSSQINGKGICQGDSGGPVFFEVNHELQLAGVNSTVMGRSEAAVCRGASEAMYIPAHMTWISKKLKEFTSKR